jgi:hypothetical protein
MKTRVTFGLLSVALFWFSCIQLAYATPPDNRPPDNRPPDRGQETGTTQTQEATATSSSASAAAAESLSASEASSASYSEGGAGGAGGAGGSATAAGGSATASNEGVSVQGGDTNFNSESNNTNVVLVPNNNTANCMRVFGLSFGNDSGAGGLGYPHRDKACDFEQAADDAAAIGNHKIAWWWRCHKKNLYTTFKHGDMTKEQAQLACWNSMVQMLEPQAGFGYSADGDMMMAQVSIEEYEEQQELVEQRINQQQNLIESLKADHEDKDAEIERLKREAARLRAEQKEKEQRDAARRAAALKALEKKEGS